MALLVSLPASPALQTQPGDVFFLVFTVFFHQLSLSVKGGGLHTLKTASLQLPFKTLNPAAPGQPFPGVAARGVGLAADTPGTARAPGSPAPATSTCVPKAEPEHRLHLPGTCCVVFIVTEKLLFVPRPLSKVGNQKIH